MGFIRLRIFFQTHDKNHVILFLHVESQKSFFSPLSGQIILFFKIKIFLLGKNLFHELYHGF